MNAQALCGKLFEVEEENHSFETIYMKCPEDNCPIYVQYVYEVTHFNNPR